MSLKTVFIKMAHLLSTDWKNRFQELSKGKKPSASFGGLVSLTVLKQVQQKLNDLGADPPLVVDGSWGPKSTAALKQLQSANGLIVDGIVGPQVLKLLGLVASTASPSSLQIIPGPSIDGIKQSVVDAFTSFSKALEGSGTNFMYTDSKGYVTTGIGNLIEPISMAMNLPWRHSDGSLANATEIANAWNTVKDAWPGVQSYASKGLTDLRLDDAGMADLVASKMKSNHNYLRTKFPSYVNWPADAQLALHSISWEWGPGFTNVWTTNGNGTAFTEAVNKQVPDFLVAAEAMTNASRHEESINPGTVPRDADNRKLFQNAQDVVTKKANYNTLYYPGSVIVALAIGSILSMVGFGVVGVLELRHYQKHGSIYIPGVTPLRGG